MYSALKHIHISAVIISGCFFFLRGLWMLVDSPLLQRRWVRIVPHFVDTLLLLSALSMAFIIRQYPFAQPWLTAKVLALACYIGFGTVALKRGKTLKLRSLSLIAALLSYCYIVLVALYRHPFPFPLMY